MKKIYLLLAAVMMTLSSFAAPKFAASNMDFQLNSYVYKRQLIVIQVYINCYPSYISKKRIIRPKEPYLKHMQLS